ncbi:MAG: hypothetical protein WCW31_01070 [Patescibacteria group bacterium]
MMKKLTNVFASAVIVATAFMPMASHAATTSAFNPGSLIKGSRAAVYYYAENGKRFVFPNEKTYFSWFSDFKDVLEIPDSVLSTIPIGGNVTYRPGKKMIKITTDPRTYAVDRGGMLRLVSSEEIAQTLYNINWKNQIDDLPDAFFVNYKIGNPITQSSEFVPANTLTQTTTISQDKGFDDTIAAVSIGNTTIGFVPASMTVKVGATVTWTNQDSGSHSIVGANFESPVLKYNESYSHKFSTAGSYQLHDGINSAVLGTINVK